jgi:hypothetical protein
LLKKKNLNVNVKLFFQKISAKIFLIGIERMNRDKRATERYRAEIRMRNYENRLITLEEERGVLEYQSWLRLRESEEQRLRELGVARPASSSSGGGESDENGMDNVSTSIGGPSEEEMTVTPINGQGNLSQLVEQRYPGLQKYVAEREALILERSGMIIDRAKTMIIKWVSQITLEGADPSGILAAVPKSDIRSKSNTRSKSDTLLGRSIANSLGRKFSRASGIFHDKNEATINYKSMAARSAART